jgi:hypothetical protein
VTHEPVPDLPPEPGEVASPDLGVPGPAEDYVEGPDNEPDDEFPHTEYGDEEEPDELDGMVGLPEGFGVDDGLQEPDEEG